VDIRTLNGYANQTYEPLESHPSLSLTADGLLRARVSMVIRSRKVKTKDRISMGDSGLF
jgi:hypothetical protein